MRILFFLVIPIGIGTCIFSAYFIPWAIDKDFKNRNKNKHIDISKLSIDKITQAYITLPKIKIVSATSSPITLPDTPIDGTLMVYGTFDNGVPNTELKYVSGDTAGEGTYVIATVDDVTTITLPTDATASVWIKYELCCRPF